MDLVQPWNSADLHWLLYGLNQLPYRCISTRLRGGENCSGVSLRSQTRPFWQSCWSARNVEAVEVNGYEIGPGANLTGANLTGADLNGANLTGAHLTRATLDEATADERTTWPEGFDPEAAGVTFV